MRRLRACVTAGLVFVLAGLVVAGPVGGAEPDVTVTEVSPPEAGKPLFGYNEAWQTRGEMIDRAAAGGATVARVVVSWSTVEPQPGAWSWEGYDRLYEELRAAGKQPLWVLADAPCWARSERRQRCGSREIVAHPPSPSHDSDWAAFVATLAKRYPGAAAIEVWNEPNLAYFYRPAPDAKRLAELAEAAGRAVDQVAPEIPVVLSGLAPVVENVRGKEVAYSGFLRDVYRAPGSPSWDAVAMHPFPAFDAGKRFLRSIVRRLDRFRSTLRRVGAAGTPIWITEIGLSTAGPHPFSPRRQADGLVRVYRRLVRMPDVPAILVHRLVDQPMIKTAESGWGVLRGDGQPKPAFCALAAERGASC